MNIYGIIVKPDISKYDGLTAKQVATEILKENGFPEGEIGPRLDRYMEDLPYSYYNVAWSDRINITEGAKELLEELQDNDTLVGMATGEAERVAKMRLQKVRLETYFKFGAYGESGIQMDEIIKEAVDRAQREYQLQLEQGIFITSSPASVKAGKIMRMRVVGVATDSPPEELGAAGADEIVKSLKERSKIANMLKS